jgi:hypothetical protein
MSIHYLSTIDIEIMAILGLYVKKKEKPERWKGDGR